jgi:hypothetical protein
VLPALEHVVLERGEQGADLGVHHFVLDVVCTVSSSMISPTSLAFFFSALSPAA